MRNHSETQIHFDPGNFISGALIGGLAAAAVVLLTAPQSGKRTRAQIRQKSQELYDQAADKADDAWEQAEDVVRRARLKTRQVKRDAESTVKELQYRGQTLVNDQKDRVESARHALQPAGGNGHD